MKRGQQLHFDRYPPGVTTVRVRPRWKEDSNVNEGIFCSKVKAVRPRWKEDSNILHLRKSRISSELLDLDEKRTATSFTFGNARFVINVRPQWKEDSNRFAKNHCQWHLLVRLDLNEKRTATSVGFHRVGPGYRLDLNEKRTATLLWSHLGWRNPWS